MWICLNDAFLSIVKKDCPAGSLLVRARRPGDIEKVFGRRVKVTRLLDSDYLFRAVIPSDDVTRAIQNEMLRIDYDNFKDSVIDNELHDAYLKVWTAMSLLQNPRPYSEAWKKWPASAASSDFVDFVEWTPQPKADEYAGHISPAGSRPINPPSGGSSVKPKKKGGK